MGKHRRRVTFDEAELERKTQNAIQVLKDLCPPEGYYVADSGGKDSCVVLKLVEMAGVKYDAHHSLTTIDPPEVIWFIKKHHPQTKIELPEMPLLERIKKEKFPPLRQQRWCCELYKERGGGGRLVVTGVRQQESPKRKRRGLVEFCYREGGKRFLNVIIDWTEGEVWGFIKKHKVPYCELYDQGWNRIGCLFCPMKYYKTRLEEVVRYPKIARLFLKAFRELFEMKKRDPKWKLKWDTPEEFFLWWVSDGRPIPDWFTLDAVIRCR